MPADLEELLARARQHQPEQQHTLEELTEELEATLDEIETTDPETIAHTIARIRLTGIKIKLWDFGYFTDDLGPRATLSLIEGGRDDA